jgi:uncharacterized protein YndB with AHSA1/START domain
MSKAFEATTVIDATPDQVWPVLTDGAGWTSWDSGVDTVEGRIAPGETLKITVAANPGRAFPVKVSEFDPPARMVFSGGMPLGLFRGTRTYTLTAEGSGTRFRMREEYTGPMAGMITKSIPDLQPSFEQFVNGLKARVENGG